MVSLEILSRPHRHRRFPLTTNELVKFFHDPPLKAGRVKPHFRA
jgi:hypothetical protein